MSIVPPSDIILDVARAANPGKMLAATERLVQIAGERGPEAAAFASFLEGARSGRPADRPFDPATARVTMHNHAALGSDGMRDRLSPGQPYQQFEAFVLRSFVETMLPKEAEAVFGSGTAGEVWKGMLAEKIGDQLAAAGGIGIAEQLAKLHPASPAPASAPVEARADAPDEPFATSADSNFFTSFWRSGG